MLNILIVSGYSPYPTMHGGAYDIWERLKGISKQEHTVDFIFTDKKKPSEIDLKIINEKVNEVFFVKRKNKIKYLFFKKPMQVLSRKNLVELKLKKHYDYVILESEYVGEILNNKTLKATKVILRSHNNESLYFKNLCLSTTNLIKKIYYTSDAIKFNNYSKNIYNTVNRIWFISKKEALEYSNKKGIHLPAPVNLSRMKVQKLEGKNVLFVGSLFMPNNIEGLMWYLKNVHKEICKKNQDYKLIIAGSTGSVSEDKLINLFQKHSQLELILNKENLDDIYTKSSAFINPMLHGTGVKIKSINAIINGLPLVSTTIGSEGIGLIDKETFLLANTSNDFITSINTLLANKVNKTSLAKNAQNFIIENHYLPILGKELV
ncbi:glycosyltransferase [Aureibaculum luteum]|uniref:glycosyltransferase n=1 Tax=Aureibaculum luteum TaxID=1548456 RepID=UPI000E4A34D6|nr:glycosyltransferase [Aureibaculum luteum]